VIKSIKVFKVLKNS